MATAPAIPTRVEPHSSLTRDEIEAIRARHPIEEVIAPYTELRKSGKVLKGHCPLPGHDDSNPSFVVYAVEQRFFCFGCDRGGDVFNFLELVEHLNFREAVERLESDACRHQRDLAVPIRRSGMLIAKRKPRALEKLDAEHLKLLTATATVCHTSLLTNREMLAYVQGRGITMETIKKFRLGYATGENLAKYFRFRRWNIAAAKELGLVNEHGEFFKHRIIFPEWREGQVVYLTGRRTQESQKFKYLGLPGAPKPLYGLELARGAREVFVVEGTFDLLTLIQWGYPAVAIIGTHLKAESVAELAFAERIYIVTDSDEPGRASAQKLAQTFGERALIVPPLRDAKDVNELAQREGAAMVFMNLVQQAHAERAAIRPGNADPVEMLDG